MKYFSVSFSLTAEDYSSYSKSGMKATSLLRLRKMLIPVIIFVIMGFIEKTAFMILPLLFITSVVVPYILDKEYISSLYNKSLILKKPINVDFYENHFVVSTKADEFSKSSSEKHYSFEWVISVMENSDYFFFIFKTNNILIIPKRVLSPEQYGMIKNLIDNLFGKIYKAI